MVGWVRTVCIAASFFSLSTVDDRPRPRGVERGTERGVPLAASRARLVVVSPTKPPRSLPAAAAALPPFANLRCKAGSGSTPFGCRLLSAGGDFDVSASAG